MCADIWGCESHKMICIKHHLINITYCHHSVIIWKRKQRKMVCEIINSFLSGSVALKISSFLSSFESSEECVHLFPLFLWGSWWFPQAVFVDLGPCVWVCARAKAFLGSGSGDTESLCYSDTFPFPSGRPPSESLELKLANKCLSASKDNIRPGITASLSK